MTSTDVVVVHTDHRHHHRDHVGEDDASSSSSARELVRRGRSELRSGRGREAAVLFRRALGTRVRGGPDAAASVRRRVLRRLVAGLALPADGALDDGAVRRLDATADAAFVAAASARDPARAAVWFRCAATLYRATARADDAAEAAARAARAATRATVERSNELARAGDHDAAFRGHAAALRWYEEAGDEASAAGVRYNVAASHRATGRLGAAVETLRESLDARREVLGEDHLDVGTTHQTLGEALLEWSEQAEDDDVARSRRREAAWHSTAALRVYRERGVAEDDPAYADLLETLRTIVLRTEEDARNYEEEDGGDEIVATSTPAREPKDLGGRVAVVTPPDEHDTDDEDVFAGVEDDDEDNFIAQASPVRSNDEDDVFSGVDDDEEEDEIAAPTSDDAGVPNPSPSTPRASPVRARPAPLSSIAPRSPSPLRSLLRRGVRRLVGSRSSSPTPTPPIISSSSSSSDFASPTSSPTKRAIPRAASAPRARAPDPRSATSPVKVSLRASTPPPRAPPSLLDLATEDDATKTTTTWRAPTSPPRAPPPPSARAPSPSLLDLAEDETTVSGTIATGNDHRENENENENVPKAGSSSSSEEKTTTNERDAIVAAFPEPPLTAPNDPPPPPRIETSFDPFGEEVEATFESFVEKVVAATTATPTTTAEEDACPETKHAVAATVDNDQDNDDTVPRTNLPSNATPVPEKETSPTPTPESDDGVALPLPVTATVGRQDPKNQPPPHELKYITIADRDDGDDTISQITFQTPPCQICFCRLRRSSSENRHDGDPWAALQSVVNNLAAAPVVVSRQPCCGPAPAPTTPSPSLLPSAETTTDEEGRNTDDATAGVKERPPSPSDDDDAERVRVYRSMEDVNDEGLCNGVEVVETSLRVTTLADRTPPVAAAAEEEKKNDDDDDDDDDDDLLGRMRVVHSEMGENDLARTFAESKEEPRLDAVVVNPSPTTVADALRRSHSALTGGTSTTTGGAAATASSSARWSTTTRPDGGDDDAHEARVERLTEVLSRQKRELGEDHPDVARTLSLVGAVYADPGHREPDHLDKARAVYQEVVRLLRPRARVLPGLLSDALADLGDVLSRQRRLDDATASYEEALALARRANDQGDDDDDDDSSSSRRVPDALDRLGAARSRAGDVDAALAAHREALSLRGDDAVGRGVTLGRIGAAWLRGRDEKVDLLDVDLLVDVARAYVDRSRYRHAAEAYGAVVEARNRRGDGPEATAEALNEWGRAATAAGRYDEARDKHAAAAAAQRDSSLLDYDKAAELATTDAWAGEVEHKKGSYLKAAAVFAHAAEVLERSSSSSTSARRPPPPRKQHHRARLAMVYRMLGAVREDLLDFDEAYALYGKALRLQREHLGLDHPETLRTGVLKEMVRVRQQEHQGVDSSQDDAFRADLLRTEELLKHILRARVHDVLGEDHPLVPHLYHWLGDVRSLLRSTPDDDDAGVMEAHQEAFRFRRARLGEHHPDVAATLHAIGRAHLVRGRAGRAARALGDALRVRVASLGEDHPDAVATRNALGEAHRAARRYAEARAEHETAWAALSRRRDDDDAERPRRASLRADTRRCAGDVALRRCEYAEARGHYEAALEYYDRAGLSTDHVKVTSARENLLRVRHEEELIV